ncbi:MAG: hypothetical protein H6738_11415 [Alphaproteobacteria bacterium]|nr:hypothetical protein [Alphaproteobacteria bacterium]MCB9697379.1 hypothetical protein [Alphaproteobacteria bacterium]
MLLLLAHAAHAAGTAPDDRLELSVESGVVTNRAALGFGLGGGVRRGPLTVVATGSFGGRLAIEPAGYGLGSLALALDTPTAGGVRVGWLLMTDWVVLDTSEQACSARFGCRHEWFVGLETPPTLGVGVAPATGFRFSGTGPSGASWSVDLAWQPTYLDDDWWWFVPRLDLGVWGSRDSLSLHAFAGRYGLGLGLGYRLTRRKD